MKLNEIYALSKPQGTLYTRFLGAMLQAAWGVLTEAPGTANYANRLAYASRIVADGAEAHGPAFYRFFISDVRIHEAPEGVVPRADVVAVVADKYDTMANLNVG